MDSSDPELITVPGPLDSPVVSGPDLPISSPRPRICIGQEEQVEEEKNGATSTGLEGERVQHGGGDDGGAGGEGREKHSYYLS